MIEVEARGVVELSTTEAEGVSGGSLPHAAFFLSCFGAGFKFGYDVVGPLIAGM